MPLISKRVEVGLRGPNITYYEKRGYQIPHRRDVWGSMHVPQGTKLLVKVIDLPKNSHVGVETICEGCGRYQVIRYRDYFKRGICLCPECSRVRVGDESHNWKGGEIELKCSICETNLKTIRIGANQK